MWSAIDLGFMREALAEAALAESSGEIPVGAVVVAGGEIIGRGHNGSIALSDPTAHAETLALREAGRSSNNHRLNNATLYVTLEPCVMCAGALVQARVTRVVFGAYDDKSGALGSRFDLSTAQGVNHRFEVNGGCLQDDCAGLLRSFFAEKRP